MWGCPDTKTKICGKCGKELPVTEFYKDYRKEGRLKPICKSCWAQRKKQYRAEHKEEISARDKQYYQANKERINQRTKNWRKDNHRKLMEQQTSRREQGKRTLELLKGPCVKCGDIRPWVIHFHHIVPAEKEFGIDLEAVTYRKEEILEAEVEKCACLCANCHTEFHHFYGKNPADPIRAFNEYIGGEIGETVTRPSRD